MTIYEESKPVFVRAQLIWFLGWLACTVIGIWLTPNHGGHGTHQQLGLPPCPSVLLFSRPCPGCGLTTAWTAFLHGDIVTSFKAHPLGIPMYLGFTGVALASLYGNIIKKRLMLDSKIANNSFVGFVAVFFVFGLARMALVANYASTPAEVFIRGAKGRN